MTKTNDYEKAEKRSFEDYKTSDLRKAVVEPNEFLAHKAGFTDGYQLGKEHAESDRDAEILKTHLKVEHYLSEKRIQLAGMAMQGLLSNEHGFQFDNKDVAKSPENVAEAAVMYADALLTELNKENND